MMYAAQLRHTFCAIQRLLLYVYISYEYKAITVPMYRSGRFSRFFWTAGNETETV